jgi:autotransporter-associated beta strand protein
MKSHRSLRHLATGIVTINLSILASAFAAEVTFGTYTATGSGDTSWVLNSPGVASINFGGDDVASFGTVPWEGTRTNGHNPGETYASVGGYAVFFSLPGVAWGNVAQNVFYPTDPAANVLHDGAWLSTTGQIDIQGLVVGRQYTAKLIFADSRAPQEGRQITVSASNGSTGSSGGVQYAYSDGRYLVVTATWTADATSLTLVPTVSGGAGTQINAVQVFQNPLPPGSNLVWDNGAASGTWNTTDLNWTGSAWTNASTNNAVFNATAAGAITVSEQVTVGNLSFNAPGYSLSGSTLALEASTITNSDAVSISSNLIGTGLTKAGAGELTLNGSIGYAGTTTVAGGSLVIGTGATFGALGLDSGTTLTAAANDAAITVNGNLTLHNGATLAATGTPNAVFGNFYLPDLGQQLIVTGDATSTISAQIHLREFRTFNVADGAAATDLLVPGLVNHIPGQAWGAVVKSGEGTIELSNGSNGQGGNFLNAGTLAFANNALGNPGGPWPLARFNGNATLRWATGNTQDISPGGELSIADGVTATLDTNGNAVTLASPIAVDGAASASLVKSGAGTLTLAADNTYTGDTLVNAGTLELADDAELKFAVSDGDSNTLAGGGGTAILRGDFRIDTSAVSGVAGGIWTLVDVGSFASAPFESTFTVIGFDDLDDDGIWTMSDAKGDWSFDESTGELNLDLGNDYNAWGALYGLAPGSEAGDADNDGLTNEEEHAFGLIPNSGASVNPILVPLDQATGTFTYQRRDDELTGLSYTVWFSEDLGGWTQDTGAVQNAGTPDANDVETVDVTLSALPGDPLPAKLFIQVRANTP